MPGYQSVSWIEKEIWKSLKHPTIGVICSSSMWVRYCSCHLSELYWAQWGECFVWTEVLSEVWLSRRNTYKWDIWVSSCNNRNWFFFSVYLFRSSKGDINSEGYVLEVECCSSLNHLSEKKEMPDFIKKVSKSKRGGPPPEHSMLLFAL